jgi:hypothetical protein
MRQYNITAQVYQHNDTSKQNLLINEVHNSLSSDEALDKFNLNFPSTEYSLVKILSVEEISKVVA